MNDGERRWAGLWQDRGTYAFDRSADRSTVFAIDTPPLDPGARVHLEHVFAYVQIDAIARYQRMRGRAVHFPMAWERRGPETGHAGRSAGIEAWWRRLAISVDWSLTYATSDEPARAAAQRGFLTGLASGTVYAAEAPIHWNTAARRPSAFRFATERDRPGHRYRIRFAGPDGPVEAPAHRPELLPSCVALVHHPGDPRFTGLTSVRVPVFGFEVPVRAHPAADPAGAGITPVCTFGSHDDVEIWRDLGLATRVTLGEDGRFLSGTPFAHHTVEEAREQAATLLRGSGALIGDPVPEPVRSLHEHDDRRAEHPLEIVLSRAWFLRPPATGHGEPLLLPERMRGEYTRWRAARDRDPLISRRRAYGVPVPVWYRLDDAGEPDYANPLIPDESALPVDPFADVPPGFGELQRDRPGGFAPDPNALAPGVTPQPFPVDLLPRPRGIAALTTALARSTGTTGRTTVLVAGTLTNRYRGFHSPDIRGDVDGPLDRYGPDGVRYWAATVRPGADRRLDPDGARAGRRLAVKLRNVTRFALGAGAAGAEGHPVTHPVDRALLDRLAATVTAATEAFERCRYSDALHAAAALLRSLSRDYLEQVKPRLRAGDDAGSARAALAAALSVLTRLLAPFLPYATEESWSLWHDGSVHRAPWPTPGELTRAAHPGSPISAG
ncbi:class I tRNA ligase family protein [Actinoplanes sp. NPDC051851]|uniref:class I tRNA ligase family protein n=1 Tax=Actinoplanes sp. NPDC051851 TaxID=3154753 RepID=UPI003443AA8E